LKQVCHGYHKSGNDVFPIAPHAVSDVVIDDEVEFFIGEAIVVGKDAINRL